MYDATRKVVTLTTIICNGLGVSDWRQKEFNIKQLKRKMRELQKLKHSTSKNPEKAELKRKEIANKYSEYAKAAKKLIEKSKASKRQFEPFPIDWSEVNHFIKYAELLIDQIIRRVVKNEVIPHEEKIFSVFQPHTEWVCKGKAGVPVELGVRVVIVEDEYGFILNHKVMEKQTDEEIAVPVIAQSKEKFPELNSCSFDKGFHSPKNQEELRNILEVVALPKKGKLSKKDLEWQTSKIFLKGKKKHSAVESAINGLEVHGLDRCPDNGIHGFKRYVGLAVLARNIQQIGSYLLRRKKRLVKKEKKYKFAA